MPSSTRMIHVMATTPHEYHTTSTSTKPSTTITTTMIPYRSLTFLCVLMMSLMCITIQPSSAYRNESMCKAEHITKTWHTTMDNNIQPQTQHDPSATRYMIIFNKYATQQQHATEITTHLTTPYTHLERNNAASHYPTDFIVAMLTKQQVHDVKHIKGVKYVVVDKAIRSLLSVEDDDENETSTRTPSTPTLDALNNAETSTSSSTPTLDAFNMDDNISDKDDPYHDRGDITGQEHGDPQQYKPSFQIPTKFSTHNGFIHGTEEQHQDIHLDAQSSLLSHSRKLCQLGGTDSITDKLGASTLWRTGHTGKAVSIAIFDTGLSTTHPHFKKIKDRTNWTDEKTLEDGLGHGTFVAGVIASMKECLGFAPDADLHIFRVFTQRQLSYTSWFMDAFNHAIHTGIDVLNLSIGGPDFMDRPFVDKVLEMSANHIIVVSAIGNDGPLYGTLNNPADQMDVIGVGGIDGDDRIARFSSRGMTTWELPEGYGRIKPDIVTYGKGIRGSKLMSGCRSLSGTSVASPVVAGVVVLLVSVIPKEQRSALINPASMKQLLIESAIRIPDANIFEQGMGKLNLEGAYKLLTSGSFVPHASLLPPTFDLTDCPYMWPYCTQELYHTAIPTIINATVLNSISVSSMISETPRWVTDEGIPNDLVEINFTYGNVIWPWSSWLGIHIRVKRDVAERTIITGRIKISIICDFGVITTIDAPLKVAVIPTPPRQQRVLWDQFHNLRYPTGYFPRDNLDVTSDILDWNGDHPHTNFRDIFIWLRSHNYFLEILGYDYTCYDAALYGTLLIVDPEEEYFAAEVTKLHHDIMEKGLSLIIFADWYNIQRMREVKFFDENTARWWMPETGGSNLPALNELLSPFGIAWGDQIYRGSVNIGGEDIAYASGTSLLRFPSDSYLLSSFLSDSTTEESSRSSTRSLVPILGAWSTNKSSISNNGGHIIVYGDSNCLDLNHHQHEPCVGLLSHMLTYTRTGILPDAIKNMAQHMTHAFHAEGPVHQPERMVGNGLARYSRVISPNAQPKCLSHLSPASIPAGSSSLSSSDTDAEYTSTDVDSMMARSFRHGGKRKQIDDAPMDSFANRGPTASPHANNSSYSTSATLYSFDTASTDSSHVIFIILLILICGVAIAARQLWKSGVVGVDLPGGNGKKKLIAPGSGRRSASGKFAINMEP